MMITAAQIRAARAMIGAKQSELARAAGISLATLNNIERGIGDPRSSTLEAIQNALEEAGVVLSGTQESESVCLQRLVRPQALDTFLASQRVLELIGRRSLTRIDKAVFYARRVADEGGERHRVCLLLEGASRTLLFDNVNFSLGSPARIAEVAGILLAAFAFRRADLFYVAELLEDTTLAPPAAVVARLRACGWQPMRHPAAFIDVFDDWDARMLPFAQRHGHPMADLIQLVSPRELA